MSLHKEICNYIVKFSSKPVQRLGYEPPKKKRSILRELYHKLIFPYYFKFIRAPYERWQFCATTKFLREHEPGLHFLVSIPNLYGAAIPHSKKK
ncbi:hypothetical protein PFFVO_02804 [Plasmodium falciparum Vietnam Oak-Knoll (FVO)]|uniref:Uncharacterized protein n=1 Tax=Plasmodium falciparum Vietnam Oak-Knoll (FVO) TaxID=1036723 RepID=A0A024V5K1_PLAFA|nr:hypothetical protein PFFVO_02804 [Plasmodium falciparum Vietnam Oak-Knoll (FVO)]